MHITASKWNFGVISAISALDSLLNFFKALIYIQRCNIVFYFVVRLQIISSNVGGVQLREATTTTTATGNRNNDSSSNSTNNSSSNNKCSHMAQWYLEYFFDRSVIEHSYPPPPTSSSSPSSSSSSKHPLIDLFFCSIGLYGPSPKLHITAGRIWLLSTIYHFHFLGVKYKLWLAEDDQLY